MLMYIALASIAMEFGIHELRFKPSKNELSDRKTLHKMRLWRIMVIAENVIAVRWYCLIFANDKKRALMRSRLSGRRFNSGLTRHTSSVVLLLIMTSVSPMHPFSAPQKNEFHELSIYNSTVSHEHTERSLSPS